MDAVSVLPFSLSLIRLFSVTSVYKLIICNNISWSQKQPKNIPINTLPMNVWLELKIQFNGDVQLYKHKYFHAFHIHTHTVDDI